MQKFLIAILSSTTFVTLGILDTNKVDAASIINTFGLDNPTQVITFDEINFPLSTRITTQYSGFGATFSNLFYNIDTISIGNLDDNILVNFDENISRFSRTFGSFSINFLQPQTAAAFALRTNEGVSTFTALLNGVIVETFNAGTRLQPSNSFYGFSGILFNEIQVNPGGINTAAALDNLQLSPVSSTSVPETSSVLGLLSMGALSIGFCHKRR